MDKEFNPNYASVPRPEVTKQNPFPNYDFQMQIETHKIQQEVEELRRLNQKLSVQNKQLFEKNIDCQRQQEAMQVEQVSGNTNEHSAI